MERGPYDCPFCGAPYKAELASGMVETECKICGGRFLIPSSLSGLHGQCVNHPGSEQFGLCSECSQGFCERCLHVIDQGEKNLYLCPTCTAEYIHSYSTGSACFIVAGVLTFLTGFFQVLPVTIWTRSVPEWLVVYGIGFFFMGVFFHFFRPAVPTLEEKRRNDKMNARVNWAECPYCKAGYFYSLHQIRPDWTVNCQNCNLPIDLRSAFHDM